MLWPNWCLMDWKQVATIAKPVKGVAETYHNSILSALYCQSFKLNNAMCLPLPHGRRSFIYPTLSCWGILFISTCCSFFSPRDQYITFQQNKVTKQTSTFLDYTSPPCLLKLNFPSLSHFKIIFDNAQFAHATTRQVEILNLSECSSGPVFRSRW